MAKTLAVFDLDGTITKRDTYRWYLIQYLLHDRRRLTNIFDLPLHVARYSLGLVDNGWLKERFLEALLGGVDMKKLDSFTEKFVDKLFGNGIRHGALTAIKEHQRSGDRVIMVTASLDFYVGRIGERLAIKEIACTKTSRTKEGRLSGLLDGKNCYGEYKVGMLKALLSDDRSKYKIVAYTDHHSDIPLLEWADEGVAVNPTSKLANLAGERGYKVVLW